MAMLALAASIEASKPSAEAAAIEHYKEALDCSVSLYMTHLMERTIQGKEKTANSDALDRTIDQYTFVARFEGFKLGKKPDEIKAEFLAGVEKARADLGTKVERARAAKYYHNVLQEAQRCVSAI